MSNWLQIESKILLQIWHFLWQKNYVHVPQWNNVRCKKIGAWNCKRNWGKQISATKGQLWSFVDTKWWIIEWSIEDWKGHREGEKRLSESDLHASLPWILCDCLWIEEYPPWEDSLATGDIFEISSRIQSTLRSFHFCRRDCSYEEKSHVFSYNLYALLLYFCIS